MGRFTRTRLAEYDLVQIWLHIAQDNPQAADTLLSKIDLACEHLAKHPKMGPLRPDLAPELRYSIVGRYLILYRQVPGGIEVVRVVHGARHLPNLF